MRRLLLIMMIALFAVGLTACGSSEEPAPEPAVEEAAPEEAAAEEEAPADDEAASDEEAAADDGEAPADDEAASDEEAAADDGDAAADDEAASDEEAAADDGDAAADDEAAADDGDAAADDEAPADDEAASDEEAAADEGDAAADDEAASDEEAADDDGDAAEEEAPADGEAASDEAIYTVDAAASAIGWYGAKAVGGSHTGVVEIAEGQLSVAGDQLVEGSFTMDMTTIHTDDSAKLLGHLKSDDFFGVETYPTASLVLKSAAPTDTEGQYEVVADLTIKESTEEITFMADVTVGDGSMTANADIVFDRSLFDVRYGSGSFFDNLGDDLINDEVEMTVELVANS